MVTWKELGIEKKTDNGELKLVYKVPETKEIFTVREHELGKNLSKVSILLLERETGCERPISHADCIRRKNDIFIGWHSTEKAYERRGAASALLTYLKSKKLPISLASKKSAMGFYKNLGFEEKKQEWYHGILFPLFPKDLELPAEKSLKKREFEKVGRKFIIFRKA